MISTRGRRTAAVALMLAAASVAANQATASAAALGASWQMNETSGTVMHDSSGNGNDGTLHNIALNGSAYGFNGTSSYVSVPNSASLNPGTLNFRLSATVKINSLPTADTDYDIVRKGLAGTKGGEYKIEVLASGTVLCRFEGASGAVTVQSTAKISPGAFHTIRCTKAAKQVTLVANSATEQVAATVGAISNTSTLYIGAKPDDDFLNGFLNQVSIIPA